MSFSGIVHDGTADGHRVHLPLKGLRAKIMIVDISAKVTITQVYTNDSDHPTGRAVYFFPVPSTAAICGFQMKLEDGTVLRGVAESKDKATARYNEAIAAGKPAGKLEMVAGDIFTISIGSIPAQQSVETRLEFVMCLLSDDNVDAIRFQLPMHVGVRYGPPIPELLSAHQSTPQTRVKIVAEVQTRGRIIEIKSPSHDIKEKKYDTHLGRPSKRRSTVSFESQSFLQADFVLVVQAERLDEPRCFAELEDKPDDGRTKDSATLALQLTIIPKFKALSVIPHQEYIFLIDRSGSMSGARIVTAKDTLRILLNMLPTDGTLFNIFKFDHSVESLWPQSRPYNQGTQLVAATYVQAICTAGGTEIYGALETVFRSRQSAIPTAIFVLTDGEVTDPNPSINYVRQMAQNAPAYARIRLYSLGIGDGVSSALCEGIAQAADGHCLFALTTESIIGKCARLLRAGRTSFVRDVEIDWGVPTDHLISPTVQFSRSAQVDNEIRLRPPPPVQQAPTRIRDLHAGVRLVVFAILRLGKLKVPKSVVIRGTIDESGMPFQEEIPVRGVELKEWSTVPLVHTQAASYLIREHESGRAPCPESLNPLASDEERRKATIIRLGERYQLASRFTSFAAVTSESTRRARRSYLGGWAHTASDTGPITSPRSSLLGNFISRMRLPWSPTTDTMPGAWPELQVSDEIPDDPDEDEDEGYQSDRTFTTMSSLASASSSCWSEWSDTEEPLSEESANLQRSPSPRFDSSGQQRPVEAVEIVQSVDSQVLEIVKLQRFDGSFHEDDAIRPFVGSQVVDKLDARTRGMGVNREVLSTVLGVAFIRKQMRGQTELVQDLLYKAMQFLADKPHVQELLDIANALL